MIIEYENTLDDLKELSVAVTQSNQRTQRRRAGASTVVFLFTFAAVFFCATFARGYINSFDLLLPWAAFGVMSVILKFQAWISSGRKSIRFTPRSLITLGSPVILIVALWLLLALQGSSISGALLWRQFMPHLGWFMLLVMICYSAIAQRVANTRKIWEGQPNLHRKQTTDISVDGITVSTSCTRSEYQWAAFVEWQETRNLFVVSLGRYYLMLPKRAFHGDEELNAFRALARVITGTQPLGFPVSPATTA